MGFIFGIKQCLKQSKLLFLKRLTIAKITNSLAMWHLRSAFWYILTSNCCKKAFFSSILIFLLTILQNPNLAQYGSTLEVYLIFLLRNAHWKNECCWTRKLSCNSQFKNSADQFKYTHIRAYLGSNQTILCHLRDNLFSYYCVLIGIYFALILSISPLIP